MAQPPPDTRSINQKIEDNFNLVLWVLEIVAMSVIPITRFAFGGCAFGMSTAIAALFIPMYASYARSPLMLEYWYVWLCFVIWRRLTPDRAEHRFFQGYPHLFFNLTGDNFKARMMEAAALFIAGQFLIPVDHGVGMFFGYVCALPLSVKCAIEIGLHRAEVAALRDVPKEIERLQQMQEEAERW